MAKDLIAHSTIHIDAPRADVWKALVTPEAIAQYMFGTQAVSKWQEGSPIVWKGEWKGKPYEDKGVILQIKPEQTLQYSHFSPLAGAEDKPENYHTVTISLSGKQGGTEVALTQDKNESEQAKTEAESNWSTMLKGLKKYTEQGK